MVGLSSRGPNAPALLRKAARLADRRNAPWYAVYMQTPAEDLTRVDAATQQMIGKNLELAQQLGGTPMTLRGRDADSTIAVFAKEYGIKLIVVGKTRQPWFRRLWAGSVLECLLSQTEAIDIVVIDVWIHVRYAGFPEPTAEWYASIRRRGGVGSGRLKLLEQSFDPGSGDLGILLAGSSPDADGSDHLALDDDGDASEKRRDLPSAGLGRVLEAQVQQDVWLRGARWERSGRLPERGGRRGLGQRRVAAGGPGSVHSGERDEVPPVVHDRDVYTKAQLGCLLAGAFEDDLGAMQLEMDLVPRNKGCKRLGGRAPVGLAWCGGGRSDLRGGRLRDHNPYQHDDLQGHHRGSVRLDRPGVGPGFSLTSKA
jgi:nucleotide-binding universal stress UspA family protein